MWRANFCKNPKNPILIDPPEPKTRLHRMGDLAAKRIIDYFDLDDIYTGVHVTPHPFVALSYAIDRQVVDYNDWNFLDIVQPGLLVGIVPRDGDYGELDADGYTTAESLADLIKTIIEDLRKDTDVDIENLDVEDLWEIIRNNYEDEMLDISSYPSLSELEYFGIGFGGGSVGNLPDPGRVLSLLPGAVFDVVHGADLKQTALDLGLQTIPQTRIMRNITDDEIVKIVVPAPYRLSEENKDFEETQAHFKDISEYVAASEYETDIDQLNYLTLRDGTTIYEKSHSPREVTWHGSGLEEMSAALPDILTPELQQVAREAGSAFDEEELREQFEEDDEDWQHNPDPPETLAGLRLSNDWGESLLGSPIFEGVWGPCGECAYEFPSPLYPTMYQKHRPVCACCRAKLFHEFEDNGLCRRCYASRDF